MNKILEKIQTARARLLLEHPFFGYVALHLKIVASKHIKTFATDGERLFFNRNFAQKRSICDLEFIIMHEIMHILLEHLKRQGGRHPVKWNIACDFAINNQLKKFGLSLPKDALVSERYSGLTAEEIYKKARFSKNIICVLDIICSQKASLPKDILIQARNYAKQMGRFPSSLEEIVTDILKEKVDWRRILYRFMFYAVKDDYTFLLPNKRYRQFGVILPSLKIYKIKSVVVAIDTSGSISNRQLAQFLAEIKATVATKVIDTLHIITCDAKVQDFYTFKNTGLAPREIIKKIRLQGRGGTDFVPVFEYLKQKGIKPSCLVYLTDGMGRYPQRPPPYPVLWVLTQRCLSERYKPPFGQCVWLNFEGD